jgi:Fe-S oxidoreductase
LVSGLWAAGCSSTDVPSTPKSSESQVDRGAALLAAAAKADAADGTVDKVVSKCVTCMLGMEGKPEHAAAWGEYTVHLCSAECKETFTKDPEKALLALKFNDAK